MREIEFRGKEIGCGLWVYGDLLHGYYRAENETCIASQERKCVIEVAKETVGQYTGLKDKTGKKYSRAILLE